MTTVGIFKLPYEPACSKNKMHGRTRIGRIFTHPKARAWRKQFSEQIQKWLNDNGIVPRRGQPVSVAITCHFPPRGGKGRGHKPDAGNWVDIVLDSIKDGFKIDDHSFSVLATPGPADPEGGYITCQIEL